MDSSKTKANWFWPKIIDLDIAKQATKNGYQAAIFIAVVTAIIATISLLSEKPIMGVDATAYFDAGMFGLCAWRIKNYSKVFAVFTVVVFIIEKAIMATTTNPASWGLAIVLMFLLINGARGVFAFHHYSVTVPVVNGDSGKTPRISKAVRFDLGVLGVLILAWVALSVVIAIRQQTGPIGIEQALINSANEANQRLPAYVDQDTRLDSAVGGPGMKLTYIYTLLNYSSQQITSQSLESNLSPNIKNGACAEKDTRLLLNQGVQLIYRYKGNDGVVVGDIAVSATDCIS